MIKKIIQWIKSLLSPRKKWVKGWVVNKRVLDKKTPLYYVEDDLDHTGIVIPNTDKTCGYGIPCDKPIYERYQCCGKHGYVIGSGGVYQSDYVPPQVPGD